MNASPVFVLVPQSTLRVSAKDLRDELPEPYRWSDYPIELDAWFDGHHEDQIRIRGIWAVPSHDGQLHVIGKLLKEFPDHGLEIMTSAAARGKAKIVEFLLAEGVKPVHDHINGGDTSPLPLHVAAYQGHLACVKLLVGQAQVSVDQPDDTGVTSLTPACMGDHAKVVKYLLRRGADINAQPRHLPTDQIEQTALDWAAACGSVACMKLIFRHAELQNVDLSNVITQNTINAAACGSSFKALRLLLHKRNIPVPEVDGPSYLATAVLSLSESDKSCIETTICVALAQYTVRMLPFLCSFLTSVDPDSGSRNFVELRAVTYEHFFEALRKMPSNAYDDVHEAFQTICDLVAGKNAPFMNQAGTDHWMEALDDGFLAACERNQPKMLTLIRRKYPGVDPNRISPKFSHRTPLWLSAEWGHSTVIRYLFRNFPEVIDPHIGNGEICNGPTALFIAVWLTIPQVVRLLLELAHGPLESIHLDDLRFTTMIEKRPCKMNGVAVDGAATASAPADLELSKAIKSQERSVSFHPLIAALRTRSITTVTPEESISIGKGSSPEENGLPTNGTSRRIVVKASRIYRLPVEIYTQENYETIHGSLTEAQIENDMTEQDDDESRVVVLEVTQQDAHWLKALQIRRSDDELLEREKCGRVLDEPSETDILVGAMQANDQADHSDRSMGED